MAELEESLEQLPKLADNLKLNIGDANEIRQEIARLSNIQEQLENIKEEIEDELSFNKVKNAAMRALPFLGTVAAIFIPGGFLIDTVIGGSTAFIADKFVDPEAEITLQDLQSKIEDWIKWCDYLKERAEEILNNTQFLSHLKSSKQKSSIHEQVKTIDNCLNIHLDFGNYHTLKQGFEKITNAQQQLTELQEQVNQIIDIIKHSEAVIDILFGLTSFFGNCDFALDWWDDEYGLIISSASEFKSVADILNECEDLKEKSGNLILQANTLRGQVEQNLKSLEQEHRRNKFTHSYSATSQTNNQSLPSLQEKEQKTKNTTTQKPLVLIIASTVTVFALGTWIGKEKFSPVQQMSFNSHQKVDDAANFKSGQKIAMEAAILVQKPPHPLKVWQQAETK
ncbi:MAG: hypothetical protein QNJ63_12905 [Calothrix sp. MO_192.B10]|nr:hypothetical protein [Calothrix sp. MO_192.B10]